MKRLLKAAAALLCAFGFTIAQAQTTTITASSISMGGIPISAGTVTFTPVNSSGIAIPFATGGGGLNSPTAFSCTIASGAITGSCSVPDAALTTPANILYSIQITNTATQKSFTLQQVANVTGTTWALDHYGPPSPTTNVQAVQVAYGTAAPPASCVTPSFYVRNFSGGQLFVCVAGTFVQITGSGGSSYTFTNGLSNSSGTVSPSYGKTANTVAQGNDSRFTTSGTGTPQGLTGSAGAIYAQQVAGAIQQWVLSPNAAVWTNQTTGAVVYAGANSVIGFGFTNAYEMNETSGTVALDEIGTSNLTLNGGGTGGAPAFNGGNGYTFNNTYHQFIGLPTSMWATSSTYMICLDASTMGGGSGSGDSLLGDGSTGNPELGVDNWSAGNGSSIGIFTGGSIATDSSGINTIPLNIPACYTWVYDGAGHDQFWQGATQMSNRLMGTTAATLTGGHPLGLGGANFGLAGHIYKFGYANTELAADQIQHNALVWSAELATALSTTVPTTIQNYQTQGTIGIFPGDSRTSGNGIYNDSYVTWLVPQLNLQGLVTYNDGIPGQLISADLSTGIFANFSTITKSNQAPGFPTPRCFTGFAMGINDISAGQSAATVYSNFKTAVSYFQQAGCSTIVITTNPSQAASSALNTVRLTYNSDIVNGGYWDGLVDIANDLRFSNPAYPYNLFYKETPYSIDGLHESSFGAQAIANRFATEMLRIGLIGKGPNYQVSCPTAYCDIDMRNGSNQQLVLTNNISVIKVINGNQGSVLNLTITQPTSGGPYTVPAAAVGSGAVVSYTSAGVLTLVSGGSGYDANFMPVLDPANLTCSTYPRYSSTVTNGAITAITQMTAGSGCSGTAANAVVISTEPAWNNFNSTAVNALTAGQSLTQRFTFDGAGQSIN